MEVAPTLIKENGYFLFISEGKGYYVCDDNDFLLVVRGFPTSQLFQTILEIQRNIC